MDEPFLCKMLQTMCDDEVWQNWLVSCLHDDKKLVILIKNASVFFYFILFLKEAFTPRVHFLKISRPIMCHIPKWKGKELAAYGPLPAWLAYFFPTHGISVQANGDDCGIFSVKINISAMTALFASHVLFATVKKILQIHYCVSCVLSCTAHKLKDLSLYGPKRHVEPEQLLLT